MKCLPDAAFAAMLSEIAYLRSSYDRMVEQNKDLTQQIIELKRDGFARPTPHLAQQYEPPKMDDRIMAAIRSIAPEGSRLEGELVQYANAQLLLGNEIEDISDSILAGSSITED
jgi:hypothetical protein